MIAYKPTNARTISRNTGKDVKSTVMVPNRLMVRLDSAAARGSVLSSKTVAIADAFAPSVTPRLT
jgi:hypothetical protein